jgi:hypothetical protein
MNPSSSFGWGLVVLGLVLAALGFVWAVGPAAPWLRLGRLPGDIVIEGEHTRFYFPIMSCILLSLLLSGIMWIIQLFLSR